MDFLPVNMDEAKARGWEQLDFVIVTADAILTTHLLVQLL